MIQLDKYRDCTENKEILRILKHSGNSGENFLWQNINNQKKIFPIIRMEIDFIGREVVVILDPTTQINEALPIFVKLEIHFFTWVFKSTSWLSTFPNSAFKLLICF